MKTKKEKRKSKLKIKNGKQKIKNKKGNSITQKYFDIRILCNLLRTNIFDICIQSCFEQQIYLIFVFGLQLKYEYILIR